MDPQCLHWTLIVKTWIRKFPKFIPQVIREKLAEMFDRFCIPLLKLSKTSSGLKLSDHHLVTSLINIFDCFLSKMIEGSELRGMSEHEQTPIFEGIFFFACVWSLGAVCDTSTKDKFNVIFRELLKESPDDKAISDYLPCKVPQMEKAYVFPIPESGSVFDYKISIGTKPEWTKWEEDVDPNAPLPRDIFACQLIIPNVEYAKYYFLMNLFVENDKPFLLVGAAGTGKSVYVRDLLNRKLDADKYTSVSLFFTFNSAPRTTQEIIVSKLDKRRKGVYGPPLGKKFVVFVDDINLPEKDDVGSQPPIELLRQLMDHQIWFDNKELFPMKLIEMMVVGTMRPPDGSSNSLSSRFLRHFGILNIDLIRDDTVRSIFSRIVLWHLDTKGFSKEFDPCISQIVNATLDVHKFIVGALLPKPYHTHYMFSLKEFSRVICGVLLSVPETMADLNAMKRLWIHETMRVYYDRLVYPSDRKIFLDSVRQICNEQLQISFDQLCNNLSTSEEEEVVTEQDLRRLLFCDFSDLKNEDRFYKEVDNIEEFRKVTESLLVKYNSVSRKPMDLVLFDFALEHLCRISRVLKQPESHALLVGVGGSGRQSLSRLAAHIAGCHFHEVEMAKDDGLNQWRDSLKTILKKTAQTLSHHVLFLYDSQLSDDKFCEDINNLLLSGEVPNLYSVDERQEIVELMRSLEKQLDKSQHTDGSGPALFALFVRRVKEFMHVIIAMSPFGETFRRSIAKFPGLLSCCTINWVHQWPNDALNFVSNKFLGGIAFKEGELNACAELCEYFHNSTIELSKVVRRRHNLFNYVTPASFLELNSLFKMMLLDHRKKVEGTRKMYEVSLQKLKGAEEQVTVMQEEMAAIQPNLSTASQEVDTFMAMVDKEQAEVSELEKVVKAEDGTVGDKKKITEAISNDLDAEFSEVNAALDTAVDVLGGLTQPEIAAVRGMKTPSMCLRLNLEAVCILKGIKADRIPDAGGKMQDDYWGPSKRMLSDPKFTENIANFDRDSVQFKAVKLLREKYIANPEFNPDKAKSTMPALDNFVRAIYCWVVAIDMFEKVSRSSAPKREALSKAEADHQDAIEKLNAKKQQLREAQEKLKDINDSLQRKKQRKAELENEVDLCSRKLERAEQLITSFGGERERWASMSISLQTRFEQLTGDILLSAGLVAYLGAFPCEERNTQVKDWQTKAIELGISSSPDWSLKSVLGNPITIQNWCMNGLLRDDFYTDNGIILSSAQRWVLMVDPQDIANKWIKTTEKGKGLTVLKQSDKDFLRSLENCIQFGSPVLLENVGDYLDPALEPLLQKQTFQQGGSVCIKLGESTIEYSKDFRMYITTRLRNPHFPPETTAKIAMVNFSITTSGLIDQLLGIIVARERPELEEEHSQVSGQLNENKRSLEDIENKILSVLFTSKGNILEDENAIKNLSSSKVLANEIVEKQQISEQTSRRIIDSRNEYLGLTHYAVTLFFAGNTLSSMNHMYQYSLSWFINLFCASLDLADKSEELEERLSNIKAHFLQSLFANTTIGLFEGDKIIYSFVLACNLSSDQSYAFGSDMWKLLVTCNEVAEENSAEGKPDWMSSEVHAKIVKLKSNGVFAGLMDSIASNDQAWQCLYTSDVPDTKSVTFLQRLQPFQLLVLMVHFRPDRVNWALREFVVSTIGCRFLDEEPLDIGKAYIESVAATPLIIIVKEEVDPLKYIFRYAEDTGFSGSKLKIVTLGSGQEERARDIIKESCQTSSWVVLVNCHLVPSWMDELEYLVDELSLETTNPDFRLWITSRPHPGFSVPTLQAGVKIALEEPVTLKTNLIRHLFPDKLFAGAFNAGSMTYRKMVFCIALFHGAINERSSYAQCGWNQDYTFGEPDYDLALNQLNEIMAKDKSENLSLGTLRYLFSSCTYGGRMEDEMDMSTLETFLEILCPDEILTEDSLVFDPGRIYRTTKEILEDHEALMKYLNELPTDATPKLTRLSQANHRRKEELKGQSLIVNIGLAQGQLPCSDKDLEEVGYEEEERRIKSKISGILVNLPDLFVLKESEQEILALVLDQELQKYNFLLETMRATLEDALRGIEGHNLVTSEIAEMIDSIKAGDIPQCWAEAAYPTMEDLDGFLSDLQARTKFLRDWQENGPPETFWLAALFEPGDFLIAVLYIHSLKTGQPFHELTLECKFEAGGEGIVARDLYLVGASWDSDNCLVRTV